MRNILVTGATGFVGSNLVVALRSQGYHVRAFHRASSPAIALRNIPVEHVVGDLLDRCSLTRTMSGCDTVFHTAAFVSFRGRDKPLQMEINVGGTRNVVDACLEAGVETLVHTSTIAALGYRTDGELIDEATPYNWGTENGYRYSKHCAELEALAGARRGLHAVIVNPSIIVGPGDLRIHGGSVLQNARRLTGRFYTDGGVNLVSIHDVVSGQIAAAQHGRSGERYILGGVNVTHREMFAMAARSVGAPEPVIRVPFRIVSRLARLSGWIADRTNTQPMLAPDMIAGANLLAWYSSEKAKSELGYRPGPVDDAMREAYDWYIANGMM